MKTKTAECLLAGVIVARATSLLLSRFALQGLSLMELLSYRFLLAFFILFVIFHKKLAHIRLKTILRGVAVGGAFFAMMTAELNGLKRTDSSTTSFLENTAIVIVPLLEAALHRRLPLGRNLLSAGITLVGVGCLTLNGAGIHLGLGELFCLLAAFLYACAIILTDRMSKQDDPLLIGIVQVGTIGLLGTIGAWSSGVPALPQEPVQWAAILGLALVCSCFGFTLQPVAQRYIDSEKAGVFCALNPMTAVVLGVAVLGETLTINRLIGMALLLGGILVLHVKLPKLHPVHKPVVKAS